MNWILFLVFIAGMLALDLGVFNRKDHEFSFKESALWSLFWIALSCAFGAFYIYPMYGSDLTNQWFTAYVLEKSLSVDNLFVISLIFLYFQTPAKYQHRALFWGIIGAIVLRAVFILLGAAAVAQFDWILYIFGLFLLYSGIKLMFVDDADEDIHENKVVLWFKRNFKMYPGYKGHDFVTRVDGKLAFTLLFVVLLMIETTDIIFAVDSIPAAFGVSKNPFILYTSNIMAVLGLRALYFVLLSLIDKFWLLKYGIALVLAFIGAKMLIHIFYVVPSGISLYVTLGTLFLSGVLSVLIKKK